MSDIVFKVAPRGEGKTKWLLDIAYKYSQTNTVYLYTDSFQEFSEFCDKYRATFNEACPVVRHDGVEIDSKGVILIDRFLEQSLSTNYIEFMRRNCFKIFIAIEGTTDDKTNSSEFEQLTIFDYMEEQNA